MHSRLWWRGIVLLFLVGALPQFIRAEEHTLRDFKKITVSDRYWAEGAHFGDFNKDGQGDAVCGPFWWEGPDFKTRHQYYSPAKDFTDLPGYSDNFFSYPYDVNSDGWMDVVRIGFPNREAFWYENPKQAEGTDTDWKQHLIFMNVGTEAPNFGDITGDGIPEVICAFEKQLGYAMLDPANPTKPWRFHVITPPGPFAPFTHGLGFGDVNGDGKSDLLTKDGWLEQPESLDGDPFWTPHQAAFSKGRGGAQMYAYDVDGDGDNDVITSLDGHGWGLSWHENLGASGDGEITFNEHVLMGDKHEDSPYGVRFSQLHAVSLEDVDGDGLKDIVTGKCYKAHPQGDPGIDEPAVLYYFRLVRDGSQAHFVPMLVDDDSGVGREITAGDVNGDGLIDFVSGNKKGVFVFLQNAKPVSKEEWEAAQPKPLK